MSKHIVLIAGPSGAGKDTLLNLSKDTLKDHKHINFLKRCITRKPDGNEDNTFLTDNEFSDYLAKDMFLTHWEAHENRYGILKKDIIEGVNIISVSRTVIKDICQSAENVSVVEITASKDVLFERLSSRGRESGEQIKKRLERDVPISIEDKTVIDNSGEVSLALVKFVSFINELYKHQ